MVSGGHALYIGQREQTLLKRLKAHLNNNDENFRLQSSLRRHLFQGGQIKVELLSAETQLRIDNAPLKINLAERAHRILIENAAILLALQDPQTILMNILSVVDQGANHGAFGNRQV